MRKCTNKNNNQKHWDEQHYSTLYKSNMEHEGCLRGVIKLCLGCCFKSISNECEPPCIVLILRMFHCFFRQSSQNVPRFRKLVFPHHECGVDWLSYLACLERDLFLVLPVIGERSYFRTAPFSLRKGKSTVSSDREREFVPRSFWRGLSNNLLNLPTMHHCHRVMNEGSLHPSLAPEPPLSIWKIWNVCSNGKPVRPRDQMHLLGLKVFVRNR